MSFPEFDHKIVYDNNPLAEVTARFIFSPLISIQNDRGERFQESIRDTYPYFDPDETGEGRDFLSPDTRWKVSLGEGSLGLSTTVYERWSGFREKLEYASDQFVEAYGAPSLLGVQLSYRDVISRAELGCPQTSWTELLEKPLHGELAAPDLQGAVFNVYRRVDVELEECPGTLRLTHGFDDRDGEQVYVLETLFSHLFEGELDDGYRHLESFHELGVRVFRWAITDELEQHLEPRVVDEE